MSHYKPLPILWGNISQNILNHLGYGPYPMINYNFTYGYAINICEAISSQSDIRWDTALLGRLTILWSCIQVCYYSKRYPNVEHTDIFTTMSFQVNPMRTMWRIFYGIWNQ